MGIFEETRKQLGVIVILAGFNLMWFPFFMNPSEAGYDYELGSYYCEASECRNAADAEDLIERGRASVEESPEFRNGIRLSVWATGEEEGFEPGLASSIYSFTVPSWTEYLKITVGYRDVSRDDDIAGRLWIRTSDGDQGRGIECEHETLFYGDTFVLRTNRTSETLYVPADRHIVGDTAEIHLVASGRDSIDVSYIRVEYLKRKPASVRVVHHYYDDYWDRWPPYWYGYHYFYWGPCYWPQTSLIYLRSIWPHAYYWHTYRPWYRVHIIKYHCHHPHWYRRYSHIHHVRSGHSPQKKRTLLRSWLKERGKRAELLAPSMAPVEKAQKAQRPKGSTRRIAIPSHSVANKMERRTRDRVQLLREAHTLRSKPAYQRASRGPSGTPGSRVKVQGLKTQLRSGRAGGMAFRQQISNPVR